MQGTSSGLLLVAGAALNVSSPLASLLSPTDCSPTAGSWVLAAMCRSWTGSATLGPPSSTSPLRKPAPDRVSHCFNNPTSLVKYLLSLK